MQVPLSHTAWVTLRLLLKAGHENGSVLRRTQMWKEKYFTSVLESLLAAGLIRVAHKNPDPLMCNYALTPAGIEAADTGYYDTKVAFVGGRSNAKNGKEKVR